MKLLYLSTERTWHGGEEQLRLLMAESRAAGHKCHAAARQGSEFALRMNEAGYSVYELSRGGRTPRALWRLRRHIRNYRPDVVHANDSHAVVLMRLATWGMRGMIRIASRRVLFPIHSTGKYVRGCDRVICVSRAIAEVCRSSGIPESQLVVVHDGVDPARVIVGDAARARRSLDLPPEAELVLCVAQLAPYKGHVYLLEAWKRVAQERPRAVLALAGDGPLRDSLSEQIASSGLADSVRLLGYRRDVPDLIAAADLFALASPEEGLGSSVLDAMFAGRAVVGADAGGIPEMLRDDAGRECGWLAAPRDGDSLAEAMLTALGDPEERRRRIERASAWAACEFSARQMAERTLGAYEELLRRQ